MPYAGFFKEKLSRDEIYIKYNTKNKTRDYYDICKKYNVKMLDPEKKTYFNLTLKKIANPQNIKEIISKI